LSFDFTYIMIIPTFEYEQQWWQQGYSYIAGVDEVGRGAWAGPVVAGAAILTPTFDASRAPVIRDSKTLSPQQRQKAADFLTNSDQCYTAVGLASVEEINNMGIAPATFLAMSRALQQLATQPQIVLIDAFKHPNLITPQQAIVKGDAVSLSIAAASIVAKVFRDNLMNELATNYSSYFLSDHKGYGTKAHQQAILRHGLSSIHRKFGYKFLEDK
jgi:ribonuclease HII